MPVLMDKDRINRTLVRLSNEIAEKNGGFDNVVLIGIKRGGEVVAGRIKRIISDLEGVEVPCGGIDIGMYRDDLISSFFVPSATANKLGFSVVGKDVVLCDDILFTGRTVRAAIEGIITEYGRPKSIQLLELVDRGGRELPIRADYVGKNVPSAKSEHIRVEFTELGANEDALILEKGEGKVGE